MKDFHVDSKGRTWCKLGTEKKTRLQAKDGIFIPKYVAQMLKYYQEQVRSALNPQSHVISLWINRDGNPLGMIFHKFNLIDEMRFNDRIDKVIKSLYPSKHITPITFRRLVPSLIYSDDVHNEDQSMRDFIVDYAIVVNTSDKVRLCMF